MNAQFTHDKAIRVEAQDNFGEQKPVRVCQSCRDRRRTYTITEISCPVLERSKLYIIIYICILNKTFKVSKKGNTLVTTLTVHVFQRGFP